MLDFEKIKEEANTPKKADDQNGKQTELKYTPGKEEEKKQGKISINDVLEKAFGGIVPTAITQYNYNTLEPRTESYSQHATGIMENLKPSDNWLKRLKAIYKNAGILSSEGQGVFQYAAKTGQSTQGARESVYLANQLMNKAQNSANKIGMYKTDTDFLLMEKTKNYDDYVTRIKEAMSDPEALKKVIAWGSGKVEPGVKTAAEAAAAEATDAQLTALLESARTDSEKAVFQAELKRRGNQAITNEEKGLLESLPRITDVWNQAMEGGAMSDADKALWAYVEKNPELQWMTYTNWWEKDPNGNMGKETAEKWAAEEAQRIRDQYGLTEAPAAEEESEAVKAYKAMQESGADILFTNRYQQEQKKKAADWSAVLTGQYQGSDEAMRETSERYIDLLDQAQLAEYEAEAGYHFDTGLPYSTQERAEARQRADELRAQVEAIEAQAQEEMREAKEALDSMREAEHGEGSVLRLIGANVKEAAANFYSGAQQFAGMIGKPIELAGRIGENLLYGRDESIGDAILQAHSGNGIFATQEKKNKQTVQEAQEEGYHAREALGGGEVMNVAYEVGRNIVEQIPDILMNLFTGGGKTAADAAVYIQDQMTNYMATMGQGTLQKLAGEMVTNPAYWTSLIREWGSDIEELHDAGVPVGLDAALGTLTAMINAAIEIGDGGVQDIGNQFAEKTKGYGKNIFETARQEATEEATQGMVTAAGETIGRTLAGKETPIISTTRGETALVNLPDLAYESLLGGLAGGVMAGFSPVIEGPQQRRMEDTQTGEQIIKNEWAQALGNTAVQAGIKGRAVQNLSALDSVKGNPEKLYRAAGSVYRKWTKKQDASTQQGREALDAAKDMLTHNFGETAKTGTDAQNAVDAGKKLARSAQISEDGQTRLQPKEGEETGKAVELVGLDVAKDVIKIKVREDGEVKSVPFEEVSFPDAETANKAAVAAMAGGEKLANALYNAQEPGTGVSFADYAKDFVRAYDAAQTGLSIGGIKAAGIGKNLTDGEIKTAHALGQRDKYTGDVMAELRDRAKAYLREKISPTVKEADVEAVADALLAQAEGEDLTEEQAAALNQYEENVDVRQAAEALEEAKTPEFGAANAYQLGLSGRRFEEVESTLQALGYEMTDEIRAEFERGQSKLAEEETNRINEVKKLNAGADGKRVGVLRSISPDEAEAAGVGIVSAEYFKQARDAVTALRGLAEATGVNMVLFESPVKEGTHVGDNGWYDPKTRTVYLDIYAGKNNERALLRTAAHELTHFIKDWSPARYKQLRDFLLDYYYQTKDTVKKLVQEQMDKDKTLTEAEAMDEVIADASEMMLDGDRDAAAALGEQHPRLFARIKGWIDTWAKALTRAWRSILPSNAASKLLKASAEHFQAAQKVWWEALEDASVNNRGEIRAAEIEEERETRLKELRAKLDAYKQTAEKRRQEAIDRANAAQTAEEGRQAIEDAQAARDLLNAQERQTKEEEKKANQEAKEKQAAADKITKAGQRIAEKLKKLPEAAQAFFRDFAERNGIAIDGSAKSGTALMKEAMHYFNQGKAGLPFNANTEAGQGAYAEMAEKMNALGQEEHNRSQLEAMAEEPEIVPESEQNAQVTAENEQEAEENAQEAEETEAEQTTEEETVAALEAMAEGEQQAEEPEKTREQVAEEIVRNGFDDDRLFNREAIENMTDEEAEQIVSMFSGENQEQAEEETEATPEETQAMETHAQTVQKMADVLKGMTKKAQNLVMKWAANEQINLKMEDGNQRAIQFAQFAKKWYDAGREGTPRNYSLMEPVLRNADGSPVDKGIKPDEADLEWPPFLQDDFYKQGKADAEAEAKKQKKKEAKQNEKPVDKGAGEAAREPGTGAERLLEEVPAEVLQTAGGGRDAVRASDVQEQRDGETDGGSVEPGTVRERGEGVHQRDDVRPATGEVEEEDGTPEEIQARETEEQTEETVEETDTRLEAETPRGTNYQIGESLNLPSGEKARYKANIEAIRLLKQLEAEGRYATPEEQDILSKYVGWGGLASAFDENNGKWKKEYAELAEMLTPEEYAAARASTTNAHYTSIEVIRAMYEGLRHLGFQGGRMLEPSGGVGHFIGAMPADMQQMVRGWTMVELDSITGRIAQKLYPNADVRVEGFENAKIGNDLMDVAIGNVPFGNFPVVDSTYPKQLTSAIHNYFFAKTIDKVRPGGLLMFITSRYTMDSQDTTIRNYMMEKADLLGAVRLPYTAFKGNAGTEVVTDILIFKKREAGTPYKGEQFQFSQMNRVDRTWLYYNQYFQNHPEMVMGTIQNTGTMYQRDSLNVEPKGKDLGQQIIQAINGITGRMDYSAVQPTVEELQKRAEKARQNTKENGYEVKNGKIYQNKNGELTEVEMKEADAQKVKDMLGIRDTARELQELQKQGADKKTIAEKRVELNKRYDAFVQKNGMLHKPQNVKLIEADPDHFFILALENYDKKAKTATKADIFTRDTIAPVVTVTHADSAQDAVAVVLNEKGYIDLKRVAELLSVTEDEAKADMIDTGMAFLNENGTLETRENYLSGDVRAKLRKAEALATVDKRYQRNVDELRKVIPEDVGRESIYVKPGATWVPDTVYEQFISETLKQWNGYQRNVSVKYIPQSGEYALELSDRAKRDFRNTQEWGTKDRTFAELFEALMNNRTISVYRKTLDGHSYLDEAATLAAKEKAEKIQKHFTKWLWENEERAKQLEKLYNDQYNAIVVPDYDGSGLTIAGANASKTLRPHQKNVVHRIIQSGGNTLIAHCVGAGKTAEMAGAAMKLRQLGIVQKPVFVVPKALVGQWGKEFLDFFPAAKILVLSENDFSAKNRKEFANRIATGDYDAIIMSREQFGKIPMTPEYEKAFYQETIDQITDAINEEKLKSGKKSATIKNQEKAKKRLEAKLKALEIKKKDEAAINFEDMGIDSIFVDEAHEYKNLFFTSNMNNISGLGNRDGSQRAFDMYMKTRYLRSVNGGRGIVFATATPVMNSMSEMYIMQKYLQEDKLNQLGIRSFDAWANLFGEVMTVIEPTPSGKGFRQKEAFARFKNLPELQRLFRSFADVKTKVEGLKIPKMKGGKRITVECEPGEFQLKYIDILAERAEKMRHGHVDPKEDNMLKITSEGRKLSYTQRMIDPSLPYEDGCKLLKCVDNVEKIWKESSKEKGAQLIFCDMATPKGSATIETENPQDLAEDTESVDFYGDIKRMLIARGVPADQIAFIHDADTNEKRTKLFEDVNEGRVRVLIGSTGKMGVGMNAQKRMVALHHLDAPWRPGDIEQREGRVLRQGNINEEVGIYVYVTKRTFDTRMWDNLYRKANFINQIMNGTNTAREVEGDGDFALSAAEIKAIATGDPMIVEQFEVANKIKQLESLEREHDKEKKRARDTISQNNVLIESYERQLPKAEADMKTAEAALKADFVMKVEGKRYTERAKATTPLLEAVKKHEGVVSDKKIAEFGGFTLYADGKGSIVIKGAGTYSVGVNFESDTGTMSRVINQIENFSKNMEKMQAQIKQKEEENRSAEERMNQPFEKAEELEQLRARAEEIANILNPVEDQAGADNVGEETEEEKTPEKKIKYSRRATKEQTVNMTTDRIDAAIKEYGAKFSTNYSKAYMTYISPEDFLSLTTSDTEKIVNESRKLNVAELQDERQTPFIDFDQQTGAVTGHEGRHRMAALKNAGVEKVAILVKPDGSEGRYDRKTLDNLTVTGQDFGFAKATGTVTLSNLIPVNESHRQELIDTYGESENKFQYSTRDPDEVSDRQLLARAYEGLAKTDYERKELERYKGLIDQLDTDTEELRKIKRQIHDKLFIKGQVDRLGAKKLQEQANALEKKIASTDKILLNMQRSAALKNVLEIEKKAAAQKVAEKVRGQLERYNAGVEKREYENRIKKTTERLAKWIVQPDKTNHVPKALKESVARFLVSISQGTGTEFKSREREFNFLETMRELQGIVDNITDYQMQSAEDRVQEDFKVYIDLPDGFKEQMAELVKGVETKMRNAGGVLRVDDMTNEQLKTLYQVLTTISTSITQANDLLALNAFRHVSQAAQNSIMFIREQGKVEYLRGGGVHNFLNWENMQPIRAFERFGEGGEAIFRALMRGQAQMAKNVKEILSYTDKQYAKEAGRDVVYTAQEVKEWSQKIKTFDVNGKKVVMPVADVMSMYCLMKRAQAVGHILGEGFRVADFKDKRGKLISGSSVTITEEEARIITNSLTARQKQVADELQKIMSTTGSRWGNYVSMKRFGYEMFTENNYFPIEVDSDRLTAKTDESKGNELYRLLNISSVKPITRGARNRLMIKNIFDVFSSHMTDMAQYNALGLPVLDAVKWINYREGTTLPDGTVVNEGVRGAAREMYGNKAARYIIELLKDVNGTQATGDIGEQISRKMLMRYNRQAVAANLSVAMKQPLSIIRASMELGGMDLLRGAVGNQGLYTRNRDEMLKYSGIALWKDLGFYDVNVSRPVKQMIMHSDTAVDRLMENATKLAECADSVTWAAIWGASKAWVQKQGKTYESTQQFMEAVAEKFEEVIYKTQVVDSILTRSQFMRGTSFMSKWLSSFMSEPTTTYNMLLEAWWRMRNDLRRGKSLGQAFATHGRLILRTTAVYMASAAVMTLLEALIGAWRDDDDYETFMEKFEAGLLNYAIDEFNPLNLLPVVQDFMDFGKKVIGDYVLPDEWNVYSYAGGSSPVYSALDTFVSAANVADKYFSGDKGYTLYGVVYKTASALSQAAGVPVAPAMREMVAIWNNMVEFGAIGPEMRIESYESTDKQGAAALYKALTAGDKDREALVRRQLAANNVDEKSLESALKSLIKADREAGKITEEQAAQYLTEMGKMSKNDAYFKVKEWDYEANSDEQYHRTDRLREAIISGTGIEAAMKELTSHGYSQKDVESDVRSIISNLTGKQKTMTATKAESLLKTYGGLDANQAWIRAQELTYQARTGKETTADIAMVTYAIEQHTSPKAAIDGLLEHGKKKDDISSAITNKYKQTYLELRKTNVSKAATLKGQLISIYEYLGYDGKKKVEDWEKKAK